MRKLFILAAAVFAGLTASADMLDGYVYQTNPAQPDGQEWQTPNRVALNKEQPHAWFFNFASKDEARQILPDKSSYWKSLNGQWNFKWKGNPTDADPAEWEAIQVPGNWCVQGVQKDGTQRWGMPIYSNQRVIFQHRVAVGDWKEGIMREPAKDWLTYKNRNEVGTYERTFTVPANWKGRQLYINFDGVDSFFFLYINGKYVGFSKNSRNTAQFNITPYLTGEGEQRVTVCVYRQSDGSFLESQDMFRLPGIFRTVALESKPTVHVRDFVVIPDFKDRNCTDALLHITADVRNLSQKEVKGLTLRYTLYENDLYSDKCHAFPGGEVTVALDKVLAGSCAEAKVDLHAGATAHRWSAEAPYRYTLVGELVDQKGNVLETFSTGTGFRKCEIRETTAQEDEFGKAGRYYYLNNKPVKMKGVNRHENSPENGHAVTREQMRHEVMLMRQGNINHVRCCHYPDDPYWYYLCDMYGIMLEDEANVESHEYYYGDASLSHVPEFTAQHVARNMEMVHSQVNHPCVVIWSLGNEAGPGDNFKKAYAAIKAFDPSRPVQYERNNWIVDMGSNQYPDINWFRGACAGKYNIVYPFHVSEYAHSMGNAVGGLQDMWDEIEGSNFVMGGAIWDWVDQAINNYTKDGVRYWGYGGDFGDKPNDGMFCMNGVMRPDLTPKAQYYEVKKVYQNIGVKGHNLSADNLQVEIYNKNYFISLADYDITWSLYENGIPVLEGQPVEGQPVGGKRTVLGPREKGVFNLVQQTRQRVVFMPEREYYVKVQFTLRNDMPWAKKGYVQAEEQLLLQARTAALPDVATQQPAKAKLKATQDERSLTIAGEGFAATWCKKSGALVSLKYNGREMIAEGSALVLDAFRAPADNDNWADYKWMQAGLYDLKHKVATPLKVKMLKGGALEVSVLYDLKAVTPLKVKKLKGGALEVSVSVESQAETSFRDRYSNRDREPESVHKAEPTGEQPNFKFLANEVFTVYPDGSIAFKTGISANEPMQDLPRLGYSVRLQKGLDHYTYYGRGPENNYNDRMTSQFVERYESAVADQGILLPKPQTMGNREQVRWCAVTDNGTGLAFVANGTFSASALPWTQQEIMGAAHPYQLPESLGTVMHIDAMVTGLGGTSCGQAPPYKEQRATAKSREFSFLIRPVQNNLDDQVYVSLDAARQPQITELYKPEGFTPTIIGCSSQENGEGDVEHLVDGDPGTIWHTAYSITMAEYPHVVTFDCNQKMGMKGFVYTPRQGGGENGMIKDYEIYVSNNASDESSWQLVHSGQFDGTKKPQRVEFQKIQNFRYLRFKAVSEKRGQSYASGAEFKILTDKD